MDLAGNAYLGVESGDSLIFTYQFYLSLDDKFSGDDLSLEYTMKDHESQLKRHLYMATTIFDLGSVTENIVSNQQHSQLWIPDTRFFFLSST